MTDHGPASQAAQIIIGDFKVNRIGLGTNRITDTPDAHDLLKAAVELGVNFIDTAHLYAGGASETSIGNALSPYKPGLVVASKGGYNNRPMAGSPEELRRDLEDSLMRLKTTNITLYQLHRVDTQVRIEESVGALKKFQQEGHITHIGLSEVTIDQIKRAQKIADITSVQNEYNLVSRQHEDVIDYCTANGIAFIPWFPLGGLRGGAAVVADKVGQMAGKYKVTPSQMALAWLLKRSPVMLPIPGTLSIDHLKNNLASLHVRLTDEDFAQLSRL